MPKITIEDLLEAGGAPAQALAGGMTRAEIQRATGLCSSAALNLINKLVADGKMRCVGKRRVPRIDGGSHLVPVYGPTKS